MAKAITFSAKAITFSVKAITFSAKAITFEAKGYDRNSLEISKDNILTLLQDKNLKVELSELSEHLAFTSKDFSDYETFVERIKKERIEKERIEKENW